MRNDGRDSLAIRPMKIEPDYNKYAEGSALLTVGDTRVLCTASVDEKVPPFLKGSGTGWVTAEYALLPRSTSERTARESGRGQLSGRTHEIQRLVGRSLRAVVDFARLGERTIVLDCDVIQADGGTRTAAINGAMIALALAVNRLLQKKAISNSPLLDFVAAISVGIIDGEARLDLNYMEDSHADVDMNIVATGGGRFIEIQGTAEKNPFTDNQLFEMLEIAKLGIDEIIEVQHRVLAERVDLTRLFPSAAWLLDAS